MTLAAEHARRLNHDFIGTEHILLGLLTAPSGQIADVLSSLGADPAKIEQEIEKFVQRGPRPPTRDGSPLTPRAQRAIDFAHHEAAMLSQRIVEPEHLLIGLLREDDGVARRVLQNLGLDLNKVGPLAMRDRLEQMKLIERIVRPIRTSPAGKRQMREELLAHFQDLFEEEYEQRKDRKVAMEAALQRFGNPATLSRELDRAICASDRFRYYTERWIGWRAPESLLRFMTRVAFRAFIITAALICPLILADLLINGWNNQSPNELRAVGGVLLFLPLAQFGLGLTYFKMRDSVWGVFGSPCSLFRTFLFGVCNAMVVILCAFGFIMLANLNPIVPTFLIPPICVAAIFCAIAYFLLARLRGPLEIRDTIWALLKLDDTTPQIAAE